MAVVTKKTKTNITSFFPMTRRRDMTTVYDYSNLVTEFAESDVRFLAHQTADTLIATL